MERERAHYRIWLCSVCPTNIALPLPELNINTNDFISTSTSLIKRCLFVLSCWGKALFKSQSHDPNGYKISLSCFTTNQGCILVQCTAMFKIDSGKIRVLFSFLFRSLPVEQNKRITYVDSSKHGYIISNVANCSWSSFRTRNEWSNL